MKVKITAFGIAKDILGDKHLELEVNGEELSWVRKELISQYPDFEKLASLKFAVNTNYVEDSYQLNEKDEVVLIPPVSGG
ncbi:MoaD/ThiS family protein [uncultured Roseivirga sp.]|uniref:MoaD/ThiS family protein n=1 Tax=uncultured Roseivirga sp. TaxID=543088 RepID=UPI000D790203|nr:MoaD/ThiS family protein [uncultured Roseivirga sp.]PWL31881.1 MAG: molybdopterin synthase sulfur carrier subunit [Roseivirga sp. XM-24bin3]